MSDPNATPYPAADGNTSPTAAGAGVVLPGGVCRYCGHDEIVVEQRWEPLPEPGRYALPGAATKVAARPWPYARCTGCGHVSRGQQATD